jgi:23S rRNA (cytidine1920-2'-O)/16S rRNA (cytidine1409-2'-O)-methyltransferase
MPRLDVWLVETGQLPSTQVSEKDTIELLSTEADVPQGFQKLKELDERLQDKLVTSACTVLDIGSSAGGFLIYLAEKGATAVGIEVSKRFTEELHTIVEKYPQISVVFADAFDMDPTVVASQGQLDLLLVDVTTEPEGTLKLIEKFTPLLKKEGRMLAAFKSDHKAETLVAFRNSISQLGYEQIQEIILDETRQEIHITAIHT